MEEKEIPKAVISRLPKYYRYLGILLDEEVERVSSADLSRHMHATASQIRQDLNHFGGFGQQGYGYNVRYLYESIGKILGLDRGYELPRFLQENEVDIAALTMPSEGAADITPILIKGGVKGIWNFSHMDLEVPEGVTIQNVHLSESLMELGYRMNNQPGRN